ncbi:MAG: response regulator transcription factor [Solirubrobacteraceae bacterium]
MSGNSPQDESQTDSGVARRNGSGATAGTVVHARLQLESAEQIRGVIRAGDAETFYFTGWHEFVGTLERLRAALPPRSEPLTSALSDLSERERAVLALIAQGWSNDAVARTLSLSPRTVGSHVRSILRKLDIPTGCAHNRRVLATLAYLGDMSELASQL